MRQLVFVGCHATIYREKLCLPNMIRNGIKILKQRNALPVTSEKMLLAYMRVLKQFVVFTMKKYALHLKRYKTTSERSKGLCVTRDF